MSESELIRALQSDRDGGQAPETAPRREYFQVEDEAVREAPKVQF